MYSKYGRWAMSFDKCTSCGKSGSGKHTHYSLGLCKHCYHKIYYRKMKLIRDKNKPTPQKSMTKGAIASRTYIKANPWVKTLGCIKNRCNSKDNKYHKKGIKNFLTKEDLKYLWHRDKAYKMDRPSIDRIDSNGHYTLDNCRYLELSENSRRYFYEQ